MFQSKSTTCRFSKCFHSSAVFIFVENRQIGTIALKNLFLKFNSALKKYWVITRVIWGWGLGYRHLQCHYGIYFLTPKFTPLLWELGTTLWERKLPNSQGVQLRISQYCYLMHIFSLMLRLVLPITEIRVKSGVGNLVEASLWLSWVQLRWANFQQRLGTGDSWDSWPELAGDSQHPGMSCSVRNGETAASNGLSILFRAVSTCTLRDLLYLFFHYFYGYGGFFFPVFPVELSLSHELLKPMRLYLFLGILRPIPVGWAVVWLFVAGWA